MANVQGVPVGTILANFTTNVPSGFLLCDGSTFSSSTYPDLYSVLGTTTLPDLRGYFLRGLDTAAAVDPDGASRTVGSTQMGSVEQHTHTYWDAYYAEALQTGETTTQANTVAGNSGGTGPDFDNYWYWRKADGTWTHDMGGNIDLDTGAYGNVGGDTRPPNVAVNYIICA